MILKTYINTTLLHCPFYCEEHDWTKSDSHLRARGIWFAKWHHQLQSCLE